MARGKIKIGDTITYRGGWGYGSPKKAKVEGILKTKYKHTKYGDEVQSIPYSKLDYAVLDLDDGHWCYGYQVVINP